MHNNDEYVNARAPVCSAMAASLETSGADGSMLCGWEHSAESPARHRVPVVQASEDPLADEREALPTGPSPGMLDVIAAAVGFTAPDEALDPSDRRLSPLFGALPPLRGAASYGRKGDAVYAVDTDAAAARTPIVRNPVGPPSVRFLSIYSTLASEELEQLPTAPAASAAQPGIFARHERLVKHPVSVGCIKGAGVALVPPKAPEWSLYWGARWRDDAKYRVLRDRGHCRVNHFPKSYLLGRKDNLARALQRAALRHGQALFGSVQPRTFVLPQDRQRLQRELAAAPARRWIMKPSASSRGRGIRVFEARDGIPTDDAGGDAGTSGGDAACANSADSASDDDDAGADEFVVQEYIERPLLINGFKVDFRLYCVVTSFDPLLVYVYNEGLVRFAATPYDGSTLNSDGHLTNFSVQKTTAGFVKPSADTDGGTSSKWTLHACKRFFEESGWDWGRAWGNIVRAVVTGLVSVADDVASATANATCRRFSCFELYGVDVMLDAELNAHLIEYNVLPSLGCGSALDKFVKGHLVADTLTLVGVPATAGGADVRAVDAADGSQEPEANPRIAANDLKPRKPAKGEAAAGATAWPSSVAPFATLGDGARSAIAEAENQLHRSQGFTRVFPPAMPQQASGSADRGLGCFVDFCGPASQLVARWEAAKAAGQFADAASCASAQQWLQGREPAPQPKRAPKAPPKARRPSIPATSKPAPAPTETTALALESPRAAAAAARRPQRQVPVARRPSVAMKPAVATLAQQQFTFVPVK